MRAPESVVLASNVTGAETSAYFGIMGGTYAIMSVGTLGSAPVINMLGPDNATAIPAGTPLTTAPVIVQLPPGQVELVLASGASGAYVTLVRIPAE